eukprot:SAG11_NODE_24531_length_372_cov_0.564103_1_plen_83_part_10
MPDFLPFSKRLLWTGDAQPSKISMAIMATLLVYPIHVLLFGGVFGKGLLRRLMDGDDIFTAEGTASGEYTVLVGCGFGLWMLI